LLRAGQDPKSAYRLANALSPDLHYYRMSLTPSLLEKIHPNIKAGSEEFSLFEINQAHVIEDFETDDGLPEELERVALVYAVSDKRGNGKGAAYFQARAYAERLLTQLHIVSYSIIPFNGFNEANPALNAWIEPFVFGRAALIQATLHGHPNTVVGIVGEYKPTVKDGFKLPAFAAGFEFDTHVLMALQQEQQAKRYTPLPKFPAVEQDISLRVPAQVSFGVIQTLLRDQLEAKKPGNSRATITPLDIFQRTDATDVKQVAFHVSVAAYDHTLTSQQVNELLDQLAASAKEKFGAERL
jgi:phenylalanyl-tRNA synthetase beta chain